MESTEPGRRGERYKDIFKTIPFLNEFTILQGDKIPIKEAEDESHMGAHEESFRSKQRSEQPPKTKPLFTALHTIQFWLFYLILNVQENGGQLRQR